MAEQGTADTSPSAKVTTKAALVVYANGAAQRVITERSPEQEELFIALDIETLAQQLGNTVL
ncbi:MAG TPA: hypothetical protein VFK06_16710, partial [Candidatus Angelobacter sp.]|nr:hypothetical protein [Candidatus Angelobacter sp.]